MKKIGCLSLVVSLCFLCLSLFVRLRRQIIFCNVGQGSATLILLSRSQQILIDAGPDRSALTCLGAHMPLGDTTIEYGILSHPHNDHLLGWKYIARHYRIEYFFSLRIHLDQVRRVTASALSRSTSYIPVDTTNTLNIQGLTLGLIPSTSTKQPVSDTELIVRVQTSNKSVCLPADVPMYGLTGVIQLPCDVLVAPHHGSGVGLSSHFLKLAKPQLVVISVGAKNMYGHPSQKTIALLHALNIKVMRTDTNGDIAIFLNL